MKEIQKILKQVVYCTIAFVSLALSAQTTTENYIVKKVYKTKRTTVGSLTTVPTDSMTKVVSYFDGLGRIKQNVAVKAGANLAANNNLAYDWTLNNTGSTGFYNKEGLDSENTIVNGTTPFGDTDLLWECKGVQDNGGAQGDGGWVTDSFAIDNTKTYRYSVWVKRTGSQDGTTYYGPYNIENIDGSANGNPYFWVGDLPQLDTWYLLVGIVHPSGYTGGDTGVSGVYDINGTKVIDAAEFRWRSTSTTGSFRNYLFYATNPVVRQYFWSPLVQQIDGNEMPLSQVLTTASVVTPEIEAKDIVTHYTYDALGRQTKDYLPYADNSNNGDFRTGDIGLATQAYYKNKYPDDFLNTITGNVNAYSEKTIEESPFNRVLEQSAPGKDWALTNTNVVNKGYTDGHTIKFDYEVNTATDAVKQYSVSTIFANNTYEPSLTGGTTNYAVGTLSKTVTKDENWTVSDGLNHTTEEFKNKRGQVVLKRTYNFSIAHDTYYVYDDFGNLTYVLPPKANDLTIDSTVLNGLCYQYKYDHRNRLVEKRIPGKEVEYIVYDDLDRPVMTQDYVQRQTQKWLYTKYDNLGRVAYTGEYTNGRTRLTMQPLLYGRTPNHETQKISNPGNDSNTDIYYNNVSFPTDLATMELFTLNYYDTYVDVPSGFVAPTTVYGQTVTTNTKGLATVSKVRVLTTSHWITTITYYDEKARPIYVYTKNDYLGTTDIVESKLDFTGKVLETKTTHKKTGKTDIVTIERFEYDHADRLIAQTQKVNSQVSTRLVRNHYDELGQLKSKLVGSGTKKGYADVTSGISISNDVITKTTANGWNEGLATLGNIQGDGYVEFSPGYNDKYLMAGLSYTNANASYCSISFAIYLMGNAIYIYEFCGNVGTNFGTYNAGDIFRVERIGTKVYYKKNGKTFYTSALTSTGTLLGDISLYHPNAQIKDFHIVDNSKGLQKVDYNYNVRGWLANINQDAYNDNDLFNFGLKYNNPATGIALYNGNISQTSWSSLNTDSSTKTYDYRYDALNRITSATFNNGNYNVNLVAYDKNGNIERLDRKGHLNTGATTFGTMDDLHYYYNGNQLHSVTDNGSGTYGFKDGNISNTVYDGGNGDDDYKYDANGNMIKDANKGITSISYNHLNLPKVVTINGNMITYTYDATGAKLRKVVSGTTTDYAGNYIYENNTLQFFNHAEGYTKNNSGTFSNVYQYRDHLGSIRLSYTDTNNDGVINTPTTVIYSHGFESINDWDGTGNSFGWALSAIDNTKKHSGNYSGRIDDNYPTDWERYVNSNTWTAINNATTTDYIISGWVFVEDVANNDAELFLMMRNAGETGYPSGHSSIKTTVRGSWVYLEKTVSIAATVKSLNFRIDNNKAGKVWFDDVKIVRVNSSGSSEIVEESNYYPFGLKHKGYNNVISSNGNSVAQKYGYTGKEHQDELGLGWIDITARNYDAALGRWMNLDPKADAKGQIHNTPYGYAMNNPIFYNDPDGNCPPFIDCNSIFNFVPGKSKPVLTFGLHKIKLPTAKRSKGGGVGAFIGNTLKSIWNSAATTWNEGMNGKNAGEMMHEGVKGMEELADRVVKGEANIEDAENIVAAVLVRKVKSKKVNRRGKIKNGPEFGDLKDHAKRHKEFGGGDATKYYNSAVEHLGSAQHSVKVTHDGKTKYNHISSMGNGNYKFTSSNKSGTRIYTHMKVNAQYLANKGITLPNENK